MKLHLRQALGTLLRAAVSGVNRTGAGRQALTLILQEAMGAVREVEHQGVKLRFAAPNPVCAWRAQTFATKEPETLAWIDGLPEGSVLWDVGANVGLYSVYAAKCRSCRVYAFEPSVFNLELLARNAHLNGVVERVCIVPVALADRTGFNRLKMSTTEWGGALSTFGEDFGFDGQALRQVFEFQTLGLSMAEAVERLEIPVPQHLKMDVDGLEHFILRGGTTVLREINSVLIEVNDDFVEQADQVHALLTEAGLALATKEHSAIIAKSTEGFAHSYNQIWRRVADR